jgi:hypothetical protein
MLNEVLVSDERLVGGHEVVGEGEGLSSEGAGLSSTGVTTRGQCASAEMLELRGRLAMEGDEVQVGGPAC